MPAPRQRGRRVPPSNQADTTTSALADQSAMLDSPEATDNGVAVLVAVESKASSPPHVVGWYAALRALLQARGFRICPTSIENPKALAYRPKQSDTYLWEPGMGVAIILGLQTDGTYLVRLDLDGHHPTQQPAHALLTILHALGPLAAKIAIKVSTSGRGFDV
jgi:hypothetical protein